MKRKLAVLGLCFALAELAAVALPPAVLPAAVLLLCAAAGLWAWRRGRAAAASWVLAGLALGCGYSAAWHQLAVYPIEALAGQTVTAAATVEPGCTAAYGEGMLRGTLRLEEIPGHRGAVLVQCWNFPAEQAGDCFTAQFALTALPENRYRAGSYADGVYLEAEYRGAWSPRAPRSGLRFWLSDLRQALGARLRTWLVQPYGGLASAMLLGDRTHLEENAANAFRTAGVSHLLAVSGLHLSLLCGLGLWSGADAKKRFSRPRILARAVLVLFYMALTGFPVSVCRAGLVLLLALLGTWFVQPADALTALGVAALLLGLQNACAPCDVGFQLSFAAVLGVHAATALGRRQRAWLPGPAAWLWENVQVAAFAALATWPVLLAHGMAASGAAVLTNLLTVWMLRPALLLGLLVLALSALPVLAPAMHAASLLLGLWLRAMLAVIRWCAALPMANLYLPRRYTLFMLAVLGALGAVFWLRRKQTPALWYLPAAAVCCAAAVALGILLSRDVVTLALVGSTGNPCTVITQNGQAAVLFRGGAPNRTAVREYLAGHGAPKTALLVDLRTQPQEPLPDAAQTVILADEPPGWQRLAFSDTLTLWLYHAPGGNFVLAEACGLRAAAGAGSVAFAAPLETDVYCAGGGWPQGLTAGSILSNTVSPRMGQEPGTVPVYYGSGTPTAVIRPGVSLVFEEVQRLAVQ